MLNFILFVCKEKAVPQMAEAIDVGWVKGKEVTVLFYLCMYLVALGPSCGTQDPPYSLRRAGSLVVACKLLIASCGI